MMKINKLALYVHWPFCKSRCTYCDFRAFPYQEKRIVPYAEALSREIVLWGEKLGRPEITSLYFGGGTPSHIPGIWLEEVAQKIRTGFVVPENIEFTVEANPEDVNADFIRTLQIIGANRVSLGVQTFADAILAAIGRRHTGERAKQAVKELQDNGFRNTSLDLMTGLPGQTIQSIERDMQIVGELSNPHLSVYSLTIAKNTYMNRLFMQNPEGFPSEEFERELAHLVTRKAEEIGLLQYEISNYAKPGFQSVHNLTYWHLQNYLGAGLSAASFLEGTHYTNTDSLSAYQKALAENRLPVSQKEELTPHQLFTELLLSGLRLDEGIRFATLQERTGIDLRVQKMEEMLRHQANGLLYLEPEKIRLTQKGKDLMDTVLVDLI